MVQTNKKRFEKEITHLKDDTRILFNRTQSLVIILKKVQSDSKLFMERFGTLEKETADLTQNSNSFNERFSILEKRAADLTHNSNYLKRDSVLWRRKQLIRHIKPCP